MPDSIAGKQRKWLAAGLLGVIIATSLIGLKFISFSNNIELMLPDAPEIRRNIRFLQQSHLSDNVIIELKLRFPEQTTEELISAAGQLAKSLGPPLISEVGGNYQDLNLSKEIPLFLRDYAPQLLDANLLDDIEKRLTPAAVKESLRRNYRQLLTPASSFLLPFIRSDPLGIKSPLLKRIEAFSSGEYEVRFKNGHLLSKDGRASLLPLKTPVRVTDGSGSRELITYLNRQIEKLSPAISAAIIAGHLHTVSNEDAIKRDIRLTVAIAAAGFFLLFLILFRDMRAIMIFLIPLVAVLVSINLCAFFVPDLSYFVVGMGVVIAGIAIDYGIHVYIAFRQNREESLKQLSRPLLIAALTTISVFAAFFFSSVRGYHQLALFSILSILLCLACALFVLPLFLKRNFHSFSSSLQRPRPRIKDGVKLACWGLAMAMALGFSLRVRFDSDVRQFDGTSPEIIRAEEDFKQRWLKKAKTAVFVVEAKDPEEALRLNESIYSEAVRQVGEANFLSLAPLWPSKQTRLANAAAWKKFWKQGREEKLKRLLLSFGRQYHFSDDAFSAFFEGLYPGVEKFEEPDDLAFFEGLKKRFVRKKENTNYLLSFFPDETAYLEKLSALAERFPGTFIVSRKALSRALSRAISSEILFLSGIAALLILGLTVLLLKDLRLAVIALVPVFTAIVSALAILPLLGMALNAAALVAAIVVCGLAIDYGIFMVYSSYYDLKTGAPLAVSLSALTTLIGAGVLLFARHPVLFSIGLTLVSGVLAGWLSAFFVVPALCRKTRKTQD